MTCVPPSSNSSVAHEVGAKRATRTFYVEVLCGWPACRCEPSTRVELEVTRPAEKSEVPLPFRPSTIKTDVGARSGRSGSLESGSLRPASLPTHAESRSLMPGASCKRIDGAGQQDICVLLLLFMRDASRSPAHRLPYTWRRSQLCFAPLDLTGSGEGASPRGITR